MLAYAPALVNALLEARLVDTGVVSDAGRAGTAGAVPAVGFSTTVDDDATEGATFGAAVVIADALFAVFATPARSQGFGGDGMPGRGRVSEVTKPAQHSEA